MPGALGELPNTLEGGRVGQKARGFNDAARAGSPPVGGFPRLSVALDSGPEAIQRSL